MDDTIISSRKIIATITDSVPPMIESAVINIFLSLNYGAG